MSRPQAVIFVYSSSRPSQKPNQHDAQVSRHATKLECCLTTTTSRRDAAYHDLFFISERPKTPHDQTRLDHRSPCTNPAKKLKSSRQSRAALPTQMANKSQPSQSRSSCASLAFPTSATLDTPSPWLGQSVRRQPVTSSRAFRRESRRITSWSPRDPWRERPRRASARCGGG